MELFAISLAVGVAVVAASLYLRRLGSRVGANDASKAHIMLAANRVSMGSGLSGARASVGKSHSVRERDGEKVDASIRLVL